MMHDLRSMADAAIDQFFAAERIKRMDAALVAEPRTMGEFAFTACPVDAKTYRGVKLRVLREVPPGCFLVVNLRKIGSAAQ